MTERSARFALPFILPGQAQKEMFHNEALAAIDGLLHAAVEGSLSTPPAEPDPGDGWIVGSGATGAWDGRDDAIAVWTVGGWRFLVPAEGMTVWDKGAALQRRWTGSLWSDGGLSCARVSVGGVQVVGPRLAEIDPPAGGAVVDVEARAAVDALIVALKSHGLTD